MPELGPHSVACGARLLPDVALGSRLIERLSAALWAPSSLRQFRQGQTAAGEALRHGKTQPGQAVSAACRPSHFI